MMWYIYQSNGTFSYSKIQPESNYVTLNRMPPRPTKEGYVAMLQADMDTGRVWWELIQTDDGKAVEIRTQRDKLLSETDWTQVLDAPLSADSVAEFRTYRQALRDITEQEGFPADVVFPEMPKAEKPVKVEDY